MQRAAVLAVIGVIALASACGAPDNLPHCTTPMDCTSQCKQSGDCSCRVFPASASDPGGPECTAITNADCAQSTICATQGHCSLADGPYSECTTVTDADCSQSAVCQSMGACSALAIADADGGTGALGQCTVQSNADCEQSQACKVNGYCQAGPEECCVNSAGICP